MIQHFTVNDTLPIAAKMDALRNTFKKDPTGPDQNEFNTAMEEVFSIGSGGARTIGTSLASADFKAADKIPYDVNLAKSIRAQTKFADFLAQLKTWGVPEELKAILETDEPAKNGIYSTIINALINNTIKLPDQKDILTFTQKIASQENARVGNAAVRTELTSLFKAPTPPNAPVPNIITRGMLKLIDVSDEPHVGNLYRQAKYKQFIERPDVKEFPQVLDFFKDVSIKKIFEAKGGDIKIPDEPRLKSTLSTVAASPDLKPLSNMFPPPDDVKTALDKITDQSGLRGQIRYKDFLATSFVKEISTFHNFLLLPDIQSNLKTHFKTHPAPDHKDFDTLRDAMRSAKDNNELLVAVNTFFNNGHAPSSHTPITEENIKLMLAASTLDSIQTQARESKYTADQTIVQGEMKTLVQKIKDLETALSTPSGTPAVLDALATQAHELMGLLGTDHELYEPVSNIFKALGSPDTKSSPIHVTAPDMTALTTAETNALAKIKEMTLAREKITESKLGFTNIFSSKRGVHSYVATAALYSSQADLSTGTLAAQTDKTLPLLEAKCTKLRDILRLSRADLITQKSDLESKVRTGTKVPNAKAKLDEIDKNISDIDKATKTVDNTITKLQKAQEPTAKATPQVNCFSDAHYIVTAKSAAEQKTDIERQLREWNVSTPASSAEGSITAEAAGISKSTKFDDGSLRMNLTKFPAEYERREVNIASIQGKIDGKYKLLVRTSPKAVAKLKSDEKIVYAAIEAENFYAGYVAEPDKTIVLKNIDPDIAKAFCCYVAYRNQQPGHQQKWPVPHVAGFELSSVSWYYQHNFEKTIKENAAKIHPASDPGGDKTLKLSPEEQRALEKENRTQEHEVTIKSKI